MPNINLVDAGRLSEMKKKIKTIKSGDKDSLKKALGPNDSSGTPLKKHRSEGEKLKALYGKKEK